MTVRHHTRLPMAVRARQARAVVAAVLFLPTATGCYTTVPVRDAGPTSGEELVVGISDLGRVALAPAMGPGVRRIQGTMTQATDSALVLSVSKVEYVGAARGVLWTGERVSVPRLGVSEVRERQFSKRRTWTLVGIVAVGLLATTTIALNGMGSGDPGGTTDKTGGQQQ